MNVIVPLNIQALRVNHNDQQDITGVFQGQTAAFQDMPYSAGDAKSSTGDEIYTPLTVPPAKSPTNPLRQGIHLHWNLPEYFKKGKQDNEKESIIFPQVPNRWWVTRFLSIYNETCQSYEDVTTKSWVVESDYLSENQPSNDRPFVTTPTIPKGGGQSHMYMGRVVDLENWPPADEGTYLSHYNTQGHYIEHPTGGDDPAYLNSIGFVGSYFSSYYPECSSVFGFWDNFSDNSEVADAISGNGTIQFRVSYSVIGWIADEKDPVKGFAAQVTDQYNTYAASCYNKGVKPELTPKDFFASLMNEDTKWNYNDTNITYTLDPSTYQIDTLSVPDSAICAGIIQEVVWIMTKDGSGAYFLAQDNSLGTNSPILLADGTISMGNTTIEALSTQLKNELSADPEDKDITKDYEFMLDALQLGMLKDLEKTPDILISLEERLHEQSFNHQNGGLAWSIANSDGSTDPLLSITNATKLNALNEAQKAYDMARFGLFQKRKQLFMDWFVWIKMNTASEGGFDPPYTNLDGLSSDFLNFLGKKGYGEAGDVISEGETIGVLTYTRDGSGKITGISEPSGTSTTAYAVYEAYINLVTAISGFSNLSIKNERLDSFHIPSDPVLMLESDILDPKQRTSDDGGVFIRFSDELLSEITIAYDGNPFKVKATDISDVPDFSSYTKLPSDVQGLINEAYLMCPMMASSIAKALASKGGTGNPAVGTGASNFVISLMYAQGGLSPLDLGAGHGQIPSTNQSGLYDIVAASDFNPLDNNTVKITSPLTIDFTFTNSNNTGLVMSQFGWNTQSKQSQISANRIDPFIPLFIIWNVELYPLKKSSGDYDDTNITDYFQFDENAVDYEYKLLGGKGVDFTEAGPVNFTYSATLSSNSAGSLIHEINSYLKHNSDDVDKDMLNKVIAQIGNKKLISQRMGSFNDQQVLTFPIAAVDIKNTDGDIVDFITPAIKQAAANVTDSWYKNQFNRLSPQTKGAAFNPLRSGFVTVKTIEVVDVFGQRVNLKKPSDCFASNSLSPRSDDTAPKTNIFLPPRILSPSRVWLKWISATTNLPELSKDPTTNPINGWIVPNHLDKSLVFYNADGSGIGSFSVDGTSTLTYKTWPGNPSTNTLTTDVGAKGSPNSNINSYLADFMWYVNDQGTANIQFFKDLMTTIQNAESNTIPKSYQESEALSVLMGSPLALTRVNLGIETSGNLLPLNQSAASTTSPYVENINKYSTDNNICKYLNRMANGSAKLSDVNIPVQLGDVANFDDGLVAYVIEAAGTDPYSSATVYSSSASSSMDSGVVQPTLSTIEVTLNQQPLSATLLLEPRSYVHATTGVLPVKKLKLPADFYKSALATIAVSFYARPVLRGASNFSIPIPAETGYDWDWIVEKATSESINSQEVTEVPKWGYSPQEIFEGWLNLKHKNE